MSDPDTIPYATPVGTIDEPTPPRERLASLDVTRGVAILGIFVMNVQSFAMPEANFYAYRSVETTDGVLASIAHVLAGGKFITLLSILFGIGIGLQSQRAGVLTFARRQAALLAIGLAHGFFLWHGDVLTSYAIAGVGAYLLRNLPPRVQVALGLGVAMLTSLFLTFYYVRQFAGLGVQGWVFDPEVIDWELQSMRGPYAGELAWRAREFFFLTTSMLATYTIPITGSLMVAGVGLSRLGGFERIPLPVTLACLLGGLGLNLGEWWLSLHSDPLRVVALWSLNLVAAVPLAIAYGGLVARLTRHVRLTMLANVGRCALSCYLLQTLIGTTLFYGHGLGWFGEVDGVGQVAITLGVWALCLVGATLWLSCFRFGPVEWLWRLIAYGRRP